MNDEDLIAEARECCADTSFNRTYEAGVIRRLADALEARQVDEAAVMAVIERALNAASPAMEATGRNRYKAERVARAVIEFLGECAAVAEAGQVDEAVVTRVAKAICDEELLAKILVGSITESTREWTIANKLRLLSKSSWVSVTNRNRK